MPYRSCPLQSDEKAEILRITQFNDIFKWSLRPSNHLNQDIRGINLVLFSSISIASSVISLVIAIGHRAPKSCFLFCLGGVATPGNEFFPDKLIMESTKRPCLDENAVVPWQTT